jgi:tripartite-type tricarboxylate transporter receptor subunit TctC
MNDPKIRATLDAQGLQSGGAATPEEFKQFLSAELEKYARIVKDLNIRSD